MKRDRIVCECLNVSERQICAAIRGGKACSLRQIAACTEAGSGCTACHPALEALLEREAAPVYVPPSPSFSAR
jgi:NAD(P)H-nitrite reductase large subunit